MGVQSFRQQKYMKWEAPIERSWSVRNDAVHARNARRPWPILARPPPRYDLLLKGGHVIDAKNNIDAVRDVAVKDGKIAAVAANIDRGAGSERRSTSPDSTSRPGSSTCTCMSSTHRLIPGAWAGDNSVQADLISFRTGVTTMVDAGSSGWRNFRQFRATVIDRAQTRMFAFVNIVGYGMMTNVVEQNTADMVPAEDGRWRNKNRDVVVGIKTAHYEKPDWTPVDRAIEAGKLAGIPVMVDFGWFRPERPYWQLVTQQLRPGDISTHMFRGPVPWVDEQRQAVSVSALKRAPRREVRCRPRWRQLRDAQRGASDPAGILARYHIDGPAQRRA